jgi:hypothetical protein
VLQEEQQACNAKPEKVRLNNYLFDKKKVKLFFTGFFSSAKNSRFITSSGGGWVHE